MLRVFALCTVLLTGLDHWTTYLCLQEPVPGWIVSEANPFADWLFHSVGLLPGLALDTVITLAAIHFLVGTKALATTIKGSLLAMLAFSTGYAVFHNLAAITRMGLAPWSVGAA